MRWDTECASVLGRFVANRNPGEPVRSKSLPHNRYLVARAKQEVSINR